MNKTNKISIPRQSFNQKVCKKVNQMIIDDEEFFHVRTRWHRLFKLEDEETQLAIIEEIAKVQFEWIAECFKNKVTPVSLEGFGKFIIRPGKQDFVDLCSAEDFDGDYDKVREEVAKRIEQRRIDKFYNRKKSK